MAGLPFFADLSRERMRLLMAVEVAGVIASVVWMSWVGADGLQHALIPTLIAVAGAKFFGNKKGDSENALGDHPAVAFIFRALTTGEMDDADDMVSADFHAYANGSVVVDPADGNGAERFKDNIEYWREAVPDLAVDLYDELSQKEPDKTDGIAVRYVISGTLHADDREHRFEVEAAAFIDVVDHKITEWRVVVDEAFLGELRTAMGISTAE